MFKKFFKFIEDHKPQIHEFFVPTTRDWSKEHIAIRIKRFIISGITTAAAYVTHYFIPGIVSNFAYSIAILISAWAIH